MNPSPPTSPNPSDALVARLRLALRSVHALSSDADPARLRQAAQELDKAFDPFIAVFPVLMRYCDRLMHRAGKTGGSDGDDLAQEAWNRALIYLQSEKGERVQSDTHFKNLLFRCAETRMVDLGRQRVVPTTDDSFTDPSRTETRTEQSPAPLVLPDVLRHATQTDWVNWLHVLFSGTPLEFRHTCREPVRRRPAVYQAFVLISLAGFLRVLQAESGAQGQSGSALLRELVRTMNIPTAFWEIAQRAAQTAPPLPNDSKERTKPDAGISEEVIIAVCRALDVPVMSRKTFHVLRNEARTLAIGKGEVPSQPLHRQANAKDYDHSND